MQIALAGLNQLNVTDDVLINFSDSTTVTPNFWLDRKSGIPYSLPCKIQNTALTLLKGYCISLSPALYTKHRNFMRSVHVGTSSTAGVVDHLNIQPVYDIYANVQGEILAVLLQTSKISSINIIKDGTRQQYYRQRCCFKYEDGFQETRVRFYFCHHPCVFHYGDQLSILARSIYHHHGDTWSFIGNYLDAYFLQAQHLISLL